MIIVMEYNKPAPQIALPTTPEQSEQLKRIRQLELRLSEEKAYGQQKLVKARKKLDEAEQELELVRAKLKQAKQPKPTSYDDYAHEREQVYVETMNMFSHEYSPARSLETRTAQMRRENERAAELLRKQRQRSRLLQAQHSHWSNW